uniref:Transposase n=1 Tax=Elaeophora elaphi TaxID=1147741 RepID=A0A0R3RZK8_9BILA
MDGLDENFTLAIRLIAERIRYQTEWQREIDIHPHCVHRCFLVGYCRTDSRARRSQSADMTLFRKAPRMTKKVVNEGCRESHSPVYAFIADSNVDESDTDYILCNGFIRKARYRLGRKGMH